MPAAVVLIAFLLVMWLGYFMTIWSRFAISQRREFDADASAVEMTKNPEAMMRALMRISGRGKLPANNPDIAYMCIENRSRFLGMFQTHPPMDERVAIISKMTNTAIPELSKFTAPASQNKRFEKQEHHRKKKNPWLTRRRHKFPHHRHVEQGKAE